MKRKRKRNKSCPGCRARRGRGRLSLTRGQFYCVLLGSCGPRRRRVSELGRDYIHTAMFWEPTVAYPRHIVMSRMSQVQPALESPPRHAFFSRQSRVQTAKSRSESRTYHTHHKRGTGHLVAYLCRARLRGLPHGYLQRTRAHLGMVVSVQV